MAGPCFNPGHFLSYMLQGLSDPMEYAAVYEQLLNCQSRNTSENTLELVSREAKLQSLRLSINLLSNSVVLKYACVPNIISELSRAHCRIGSRAFCAGNLAGQAIILLHNHGTYHRALPALQQRRAMLSVSFGYIDFVEFVVGFVNGISKQPTKMLFVSGSMCAFKVANTVISLVIEDSGIVVVMPFGRSAEIRAPSGISRGERAFVYSGFGLDRYLATICFSVVAQVSAPVRSLLSSYHILPEHSYKQAPKLKAPLE